MSASVRNVWDMHQPYYDSQCKTMSGTWHRHRDECQCTYMVSMSNELNLENVTRVDDNDVIKLT
ncbi:UDP-N-acetylmuramoylalanine--D-glutamate ligase [Gossypium arboreum]|uniref:UDP-N-acetylmuramoylalanine--D-glutamate ligase n=1 Tax=Gossypium arboreum TaxID=29729 RepID=A0A0B0P0C3_GOSAR|nr:UDP-N-acetylmuramoylalanine--D-glutamate ligase [Gossypium arboreum]